MKLDFVLLHHTEGQRQIIAHVNAIQGDCMSTTTPLVRVMLVSIIIAGRLLPRCPVSDAKVGEKVFTMIKFAAFRLSRMTVGMHEQLAKRGHTSNYDGCGG